DYEDFYALVDAFHEITIDEYAEKYHEYIDTSTRLLAICYDVRHAYMGDREIALVDNNLDEDKQKWHGIKAPKKNVYYECNCLYPEMIFATIAINELINIRMMTLSKKNHSLYGAFIDKKVIWDKPIAVLRGFQSAFAECVRETLTPNLYSRWLTSTTKPYSSIHAMAGQYLDVINLAYIDMTKEKRLKSFTAITRRISDYWLDDEYQEIKRGVTQAAKLYGCAESEIQLRGIEYPDEIEW
ncbi:MAG: hypothetical protein FWH49_05100, partial [Clostridiales bacterium]|nr:hypothetical protein [Clostridiales bacterium]